MSETIFILLDELKQSDGAVATIDRLIETLRAQKDFHKLFDALLLKKKYEMGLPLVSPAAFDDVPQDKQAEFEERYIEAARTVGESFLAENNIPQAWVYLRTIREPEKVAKALDELDPCQEATEETEELINVALHEGANPLKGLELMLRTHGTCSTITALDQQIHQMSPDVRKKAASLLIDELYDDLGHTLRREVEQKLALAPAGKSLRELITGRDWLFEEGNYHIDVSHLNSVVRFARFLNFSDSALQKAIELAEYGSKLSDQFQYPGDPPFDDFYPAHLQYFNALADNNRDEALAYFRERLDTLPEEEDKRLIAYVLVDLLVRVDRLDEAIEVAQEHLKDIDESIGFSFAELCQQAGRMDTLREVAREKGDLIRYTAALLG